MMTYPRTPKKNAHAVQPTQEKQQEGVRVDGFDQIFSMLKVADDDFRESLLYRISARDPQLAKALRDKLE